MFVRATASTASGQLAVNDYGWHASDAVLFCLGSYFRLLHVMNDHLMGRACNLLHQFDGFLACRAASTKDFDLLSCVHGVLPILLRLNSSHFFSFAAGAHCHFARWFVARPRIPQ